jgi:hypothetical protein
MAVRKITLFDGRNIKVIIANGATFCQVARIIQIGQEALDITEGNQKWVGAAPNLIVRAILIRIRGISWFVSRMSPCEMQIYEIRKALEPRACAKKYFTAASDSNLRLFISIKGIRDIRFSSREAHITKKDLAERTANVLMIRVAENSIACGRRRNMIVKKRVELFRVSLEGYTIPDFTIS